MTPRLDAVLTEAGHLVENGHWEAVVAEGHGACVPIAWSVARLFTLNGITAHAYQASMRVHDPLNQRWAQIQPMDDERGLFPGHMVTYLPGFSLMVDGSLKSQGSTVLRNLDPPTLLAVGWSHRKPGPISVRIGRGTVEYAIDRKGKVWRKFRWPWDEIGAAVDKFHAGYVARMEG